MNEENVSESLGGVVGRERVVDGADARGDEDGKDEGDDKVAADKDVHKDRVQHGDQPEAVPDRVDRVVRLVEELVHDVSEQEEVAGAAETERGQVRPPRARRGRSIRGLSHMRVHVKKT